MRILPRILKILGLFIFIWLSLNIVASFYLTWPKTEDIPHGRTFFFQDVKELLLKTEDNLKIAAWLIPNNKSQNVIILLNGIKGNRKGLIKRAKFYWSQGFSVMLPDLRATGESQGSMVGLGWLEQKDLAACYAYLTENGYNDISAHGLSLGAATIAYSLDDLEFNFLVFESCYDNIDQALANRLHSYFLPSFFLAVTQLITEIRLGADSNQLSPEEYMNLAKAPTLFLAGDSEKKVKKAETEKLYEQCGSENKQLHFFRGGFHEDFMNRYEKEWTQVMEEWLNGLGY